MCGMPCAVRLITALAASALAGTSRSAVSAATKIPHPLTGWDASTRRPLRAQLEVLRPLRVGAVEHFLDRLVRRTRVEVVHRHRHVAGRLRDGVHAELGLDDLQQLGRARAGVLDSEDDYSGHLPGLYVG